MFVILDNTNKQIREITKFDGGHQRVRNSSYKHVDDTVDHSQQMFSRW